MDSLRPMLNGPLSCSYDDALNACRYDLRTAAVTVNAPGQGRRRRLLTALHDD